VEFSFFGARIAARSDTERFSNVQLANWPVEHPQRQYRCPTENSVRARITATMAASSPGTSRRVTRLRPGGRCCQAHPPPHFPRGATPLPSPAQGIGAPRRPAGRHLRPARPGLPSDRSRCAAFSSVAPLLGGHLCWPVVNRYSRLLMATPSPSSAAYPSAAALANQSRRGCGPRRVHLRKPHPRACQIARARTARPRP
jgi:hypothetical protein